MSGFRADAAYRLSRACQDCTPESQLIEVADSVWIWQILHDDTCPWLNARRQEPCS